MLKRFAACVYALLCVVGAFKVFDLIPPVHAAILMQNRAVYFPGNAADWQLPAGHFQASIFPLKQLYPLSQTDRTADGGGTAPSWAYHLLGPTVHSKVIRIVTRGGCPPWHYDLTGTTLVGATINNDHTSQSYGALTIPAQSAATYTISVRTQDQCAGDITVSWSYVVASEDGSNFVHVTAGAGGSETGTHANPFRQLADVLGPDEDDATHANKQIIFSGTFDLVDTCSAAECGGTNDAVELNNNKPRVWMAASADATLFRGSSDNTEGANLGVGGGPDWVFAGINWDNPHQVLVPGSNRNAFIRTDACAMRYGGVFDGEFDQTSDNINTDGSNSASILYNQSTQCGFSAMAGNTVSNGPMGFLKLYDVRDIAVMHNVLINAESNGNIEFKGGDRIQDVFVAFNSGNGSSVFSLIDNIDFNDPLPSPWLRTNFEYMHNLWVSTGNCIQINGTADFQNTIFTKRNNWKCDHHQFGGSDVVLVSSEFSMTYDAIEHDGSCTQGVCTEGAGATITISNNSHGTSGILNDTTGAQDAPDGTKGREISAVFNAPNLLDVANDEVFDMRLAA